MATVVDPQGRRWTVRRRWLGGLTLPKWRGVDFDVGDGLAVLDGPGIAGILVGAVLLATVVLFALPLLLWSAEVVILLGALVAGLGARLASRKPWTLVVLDGTTAVQRREVLGWRESREALREMRAQVEAGTLRSAHDPPYPRADEREATRATLALALAILWLGGLGSAAAIVLVRRTLGDSDDWAHRTLAFAAIVIGAAGIVLAAAMVIGLASRHEL